MLSSPFLVYTSPNTQLKTKNSLAPNKNKHIGSSRKKKTQINVHRNADYFYARRAKKVKKCKYRRNYTSFLPHKRLLLPF